MEIGQQLLFFFSSLGVFNGLLMSLYFLFSIKPKRLQNQLFGLLLLMLTIRIGKSVLHHFTDALSRNILQLGLSACLFIGPFLWLYVRSVNRTENKLRQSDIMQLAGWFLAIVTVGILFPYTTKPEAWNPLIVQCIYSVWMFYTLLAGFELRKLIQVLFKNAASLTSLQKWVITVFGANALICLFFNSVLYLSFPSYILGPITFSFVFYGLLAFSLFSPNREAILKGQKKRYANKDIPTAEADALQQKLVTHMEETKAFKNPTLKLDSLANELGVSTHLLSQYLNDNLGKSFSAFVNEYRVKAACGLLKTEHHLTLEGIGQEVGFRSKSSFYAAFKKQFGTTPSQYAKEYLV